MAILSYSTFRQMFDANRIEQLASDADPKYNRAVFHVSYVNTALGQAEGEVRSALSLQYSTAEMEADENLERVVGSIAMYNLELRRGDFTEQIATAYKWAQEQLRLLRDGTIKLADTAQLLPSITQPEDEVETTEATGSGFFD